MATLTGQGRITAKFNAKLKSCERVNYQDSIFYHPVEDIKSWMLETSDGENNVPNVGLLLDISNLSGFASTRPDDIANALLVFAILLRLQCGHLIHIFQQVVHDDTLDADLRKEDLLSELKRSNLPHPPDILEQFDRERWSFCPAKIEDMCHHTKAYYGGRWILPFCRRQIVGKGGTAAVYGVLVQADIVPENLKNEVLRGYGYADPDFGDVSPPSPFPAFPTIFETNNLASSASSSPSRRTRKRTTMSSTRKEPTSAVSKVFQAWSSTWAGTSLMKRSPPPSFEPHTTSSLSMASRTWMSISR